MYLDKTPNVLKMCIFTHLKIESFQTSTTHKHQMVFWHMSKKQNRCFYNIIACIYSQYLVCRFLKLILYTNENVGIIIFGNEK